MKSYYKIGNRIKLKSGTRINSLIEAALLGKILTVVAAPINNHTRVEQGTPVVIFDPVTLRDGIIYDCVTPNMDMYDLISKFGKETVYEGVDKLGKPR
jgi:hypothetical protein